MGEFIVCSYRITLHGRHVTDGVFNAAEEIFERIRCQRAGVYSVYRRPTSDEESPHDGAILGRSRPFRGGQDFLRSRVGPALTIP